jgi:hypothetical protein
VNSRGAAWLGNPGTPATTRCSGTTAGISFTGAVATTGWTVVPDGIGCMAIGATTT